MLAMVVHVSVAGCHISGVSTAPEASLFIELLPPVTNTVPSGSCVAVIFRRGLAMGLLFIPITTLSLSTLKGRQIGEGAAFTGMARQLGGSFGVALITTFMARQNVVHQSNLSVHLDKMDPDVQSRVYALTQSFIAKGEAPNIAQLDAYKALGGAVAKQAARKKHPHRYPGSVFYIPRNKRRRTTAYQGQPGTAALPLFAITCQ